MSRPAPRAPLTDAQRDLAASFDSLAIAMAQERGERAGPQERLDDLVSDARLGLVRAAQRYDATRGVRFGQYAAPWIRGAIGDGLRKRAFRSRCVDGPGGHRPMLLSLSRRDAQQRGVADFHPPELRDPGAGRPPSRAEQLEDLEALIGPGLPERQRTILLRFYGAASDSPVLFREIAAELGVSGACVSIDHKAALATLRARLRRCEP